jgi:hypothetical protein
VAYNETGQKYVGSTDNGKLDGSAEVGNNSKLTPEQMAKDLADNGKLDGSATVGNNSKLTPEQMAKDLADNGKLDGRTKVG